MKVKYLSVLVVVSLCACAKRDGIVIEPIDEELNRQLITGERLNVNLFSSRNIVQYYQISNSDTDKSQELRAAIDEMIQRNYSPTMISSFETMIIHIYRKGIFDNYEDEVYQAARDNEFGSLDNRNGDKIGLVYFRTINRKLVREVILYHKDSILHAATDTVLINEK